MTQTLPGTRYGSLNAWPDPDAAGRWRYLPLAPSPQRDDAGRASVTVIEAGGMVMLTIGAELGATAAEIAAAKAAIAAAAKVDAATIDLRPAEVTVTAAGLVLVDGTGAETLLASARPSSFPPYAGAFSAMAQGDAGKTLKAAIKGDSGKVLLRYDIQMLQTRAAQASIKGQWPGDSSMDAALENAQLVIEVMADDGASSGLIAKAVQRVKMQAAGMAARMAEPPRPTGMPDRALAEKAAKAFAARQETVRIATSATETETVAKALQIQGEIAPWLK